ncbi:MAG: DUF6465 family protein [Oscillospiraceae bacterium]|nr:DUF6465 family protein [Oscillospiraceae bacterium]
MPRKTSKPAADKKEQLKTEAVIKPAEEKAAVITEDTAVSSKEKKTETAAKPEAAAVCTKVTKENAIIQFSGIEVCVADVIEKAKKLWNEEHAGQALESISVYIKPEESRVYYVANNIDNGDFEM